MIVTASIVIYNENKETLQHIIESFLGTKLDKELIIVDNSPQSVFKEFVESYNNVHYIHSKTNLGFGAGHNLAYKNFVKKSDLHLILNPDIYFDARELDSFLEWLYTAKGVSLALPQILNPDGTVQKVVRFIPNPLNLIKRRLRLSDNTITIEANSVLEIPFAHGCFMAFKEDSFRKINGFDERFFLYMEDVDIFLRAKKYGKTVINTHFFIYHKHRKGSSKSIKLLCYHIISALKFFYKWK